MSRDRDKKFDKRIGCLQFVFTAFLVVFLFYLFLIQILDIRHYRDRAKQQRTSKVSVLRGEIIDRNRMKLASDLVFYDVFAVRQYFDHTPEELANILAPMVDTPRAKLLSDLKNEDLKVVLVKKTIDRKTAEAIRALKLREISLERQNKRVYPQGSLASHILGYYNPDADIAAGIEYVAKSHLEYYDRSTKYEKTRDGDIIYSFGTNPEDVSALPKGKTLQLTIDSAIQHICEKSLYKTIQKTRALRGAVIVLDPKTGEILAMAVYPYYDPNNYGKYSLLELKNWAITDVYPPGSTFKVITVASGFINEKINKNTKILDTGKMLLGWWTVENYDYKKVPNPGLIDLVYLFEHSSNIGSAKIAHMLSAQEFYDTLRMFNFGDTTGIDLPGESQGILPKPKNWDIATHGTMGFGYGASVTAIQMAAAVAAIANNGVWITPHVIKYSPEEYDKKVATRRVMQEDMAKDLTNVLVKSIDAGSSVVKMNDFSIAAKTGTSRRPKDNGAGYTNKLYTSIVGYIPASDPKALVYVVVDSPEGEGVWGSTVAAPVFKEIVSELVKIMNMNPDRKNK